MISLGDKVKQARKEKGLTQSELVDNVISRSMLSHIENGNANPSMSTLEYIAKKLDKPISYFLSDNESNTYSFDSFLASVEKLIELEKYHDIIVLSHNYIDSSLNNNISLLKMNQIGILNAIIGISYYHTNNKKSKDLLLEAIDDLKDSGYNPYLINAYKCLSLIMFSEKRYYEMEQYLRKADSLIPETTLANIQTKLNIAYNLALSYYRQRKYRDAADTINNILKYCSKYELFYNFGEFSILLALSYRHSNNLSKAIEATFDAINYYSITKNSFMKYRSYINLSNFYRLKLDNFHSMYYINEAIKYFESINDTKKIINARVEKIVSMFIFKTDTDMISDMIYTTINIAGISNTVKGELTGVLGFIEYKKGNFDKSLVLLKEAEAILMDNINTDVNIFIYYGLYNIFKETSDFVNEELYRNILDEEFRNKPYYKNFFEDEIDIANLN